MRTKTRLPLFPNIIKEMAAIKLSQTELAHKLGVNYSTINHKLNGKTEFTRKEMLAICKILKRSMDELFGETEREIK